MDYIFHGNSLQAVSAEDATKNITDPEELQYDLVTPLKFTFFPVVDNYAKNPFLPVDPLEAMKTGMFNRIIEKQPFLHFFEMGGGV